MSIFSAKRLTLSDALCCLVLVFCGLSALADLTGNAGLWTLGGAVGPARWTIAMVALLALALLAKRNGNGGPFVRAEEYEKK